MQRAAGNTNSTVVQDSSFLLHLWPGLVSCSGPNLQVGALSQFPHKSPFAVIQCNSLHSNSLGLSNLLRNSLVSLQPPQTSRSPRSLPLSSRSSNLLSLLDRRQANDYIAVPFRCSAHRPANGVPPLGRGSAPFDVTWWLLPSLLQPLFQCMASRAAGLWRPQFQSCKALWEVVYE